MAMDVQSITSQASACLRHRASCLAVFGSLQHVVVERSDFHGKIRMLPCTIQHSQVANDLASVKAIRLQRRTTP